MKKFLLFFCVFAVMFGAVQASAQEAPQDDGSYAPANNYPPQQQDDQGWFIGTDQGVLFFVGNSGKFLDPQYYSSFYGGYNIRGIVQPLIRFSQALGTTSGFFSATTFFFTVEGGLRITPIRTKFRPYFIGTVGFYHLDFNDFGSPIFDDTNFTFTGGGGIEYKFGSSRISLGSEYRGFTNQGLNPHGVQVTFGYTFQF